MELVNTAHAYKGCSIYNVMHIMEVVYTQRDAYNGTIIQSVERIMKLVYTAAYI